MFVVPCCDKQQERIVASAEFHIGGINKGP